MKKRNGAVILCLIYSLSIPAMAFSANSSVVFDSVIGSAAGAAIGSAVGGRKGALIGAGLGALTGASVATSDEERPYGRYRRDRYYEDAPQATYVREYPPPRHNGSDAVFGGVIGGTAGAAIGSAVGGRKGALIGAGLGALTGASVATSEEDPYSGYRRHSYYDRGWQWNR